MDKLKQAARQALEALIEANVVAERYQNADKRKEAITALQEALAEKAGHEPAAKHWHDLYRAKCQELHDERARLGAEIVALEAEQAEQEPVAWWNGKETVWFEHELITDGPVGECKIPLYAAPVRTKDLLNQEILEATVKVCLGPDYFISVARAVDQLTGRRTSE